MENTIDYIMRKQTRTLWLLALTALPLLPARAQEAWTLERCMQYAVEHNHDVRLQQFSLDDARAERLRARGSFLPSLDASGSAQFNFGRAIDPETNTYTNVSTFYNGYGVQASIPVFDGLQRWNGLQTAKLNVALGRESVRACRDEVAQQVMRQYVDALYCRGALDLARGKRAESAELLRRARVMVEVGTRSAADTAQMRATYAADDYEVTRQENLLATAVRTLKQLMNYPIDEELVLEGTLPFEPQTATPAAHDVAETALASHPSVRMAELNVQTALRDLRSARGAFFPSISLGAGVSTTYYRQTGGHGGVDFRTQLRNNMGEYVYAGVSVPLFSRLGLICNLKRRKNHVERARENLDAERTELRRLVQEATADHRAALQEMDKMRRKVEADSLAAHLVVRQFEEGIASPVDVQTATVSLLQSRASLLQSRLGYVYVKRMLDYYQGIPLYIYGQDD